MRLYQALLLLFPAAFRAEYGDEMYAIFSARRRDASSILAIAGLWLETLADLFLTALQTQFDVLRQDLRYAFRALKRSPGIRRHGDIGYCTRHRRDNGIIFYHGPPTHSAFVFSRPRPAG
jgi:hypothetical protein